MYVLASRGLSSKKPPSVEGNFVENRVGTVRDEAWQNAFQGFLDSDRPSCPGLCFVRTVPYAVEVTLVMKVLRGS